MAQPGRTVAPAGTPKDGQLACKSKLYFDAAGFCRRLPVHTCRAPGAAGPECEDREDRKWRRAGFTPADEITPEEIARRRTEHAAETKAHRAKRADERNVDLVSQAVAAAFTEQRKKGSQEKDR